jgi:hypothetical protein
MADEQCIDGAERCINAGSTAFAPEGGGKTEAKE